MSILQNQWIKMTGKIMGNELITRPKWAKIDVSDRHRMGSDNII